MAKSATPSKLAASLVKAMQQADIVERALMNGDSTGEDIEKAANAYFKALGPVRDGIDSLPLDDAAQKKMNPAERRVFKECLAESLPLMDTLVDSHNRIIAAIVDISSADHQRLQVLRKAHDIFEKFIRDPRGLGTLPPKFFDREG